MSLQIDSNHLAQGKTEMARQGRSETTGQAADRFASFFRKGNVKHLDGAQMAMSRGKDAKNSYFSRSRDGVTVQYNEVTFFCNHQTGALELGDCSHPEQCVRVPLERGGSLLFNPDSIGGVNQAIGMFSAEDQGRILRAIEMYQMAEQKLEELEEDTNADPKTVAQEDSDEADQGKSGANEADEQPFATMAERMTGVTLREQTAVYEIYDIDERFAG